MREHWLLPTHPYQSWKEYLAAVGGDPMERALSLSPAQILEELKRSGLRGRGGAGFPTGVKWSSVASHPCRTRHAVCNAAEGEPGTFKDRWLIRHNPYAVLAGLLIGAHVVGARKAYLALKASFTVEIARLRAALDEMRPEIPVEIVEGPEEYLFGEEKALLNVIEGIGPLPREAHSPPYEVGLFATPGSPNPALVNNAETYAHVASIVLHGGASFRKLGTDDTPGTVLYTLSGDLARPGVYEAEPKLTVRELLEQLGHGPRPGRSWKALLSGVSTGVLLPDRFDTVADFGHMQLAGSGLGSAGFVLFDDETWMPRVAQAMARFLYVESCNQCSACKTGLGTASSAIDELFDPQLATPDDPERALVGATHAPQGNRCYLPVQGSILIPSLFAKFSSEFDEQLAHPARGSREVLVPKIVDFDGTSFTYDEHQPFKQPDWTYRERPQQPTARPAKKPRGHLAVRISPDVERMLRALAEERGVALDRLVDEALRDWLNQPR
jgi:NADH:ubiquinone oxidoreductase subunit F (NADH-binding)